eukprot:GHVS01035862.1.p1 GENE.GHVS01035862.1~~GHVS01035862.1.p1  ORF type:complete len:144 (-),score=24.59 GHVS01035862.1:402-833(-)
MVRLQLLNSQDAVMQSNLLNLLKVVMFKSHASGPAVSPASQLDFKNVGGAGLESGLAGSPSWSGSVVAPTVEESRYEGRESEVAAAAVGRQPITGVVDGNAAGSDGSAGVCYAIMLKQAVANKKRKLCTPTSAHTFSHVRETQ